MNKDDIVGVYRTLGEDTVRADGTVVSDNARSAQIMYSPDGYMSVVSMPNGRKLLAKTSGGPDLNAATSEERAAAADGMVCYAGHYELKDSVLHHHDVAQGRDGAQPERGRANDHPARDAQWCRSHAVISAGAGRQLPPHPLAAGLTTSCPK